MLTIVQNAKLLPNRHQTFCEAFPGVPKLPKLSGVSNQNLVGLVFPTVYRLEGRALIHVAARPCHPVGPPLTYTPVVLWLAFSRRAARRTPSLLPAPTRPQFASWPTLVTNRIAPVKTQMTVERTVRSLTAIAKETKPRIAPASTEPTLTSFDHLLSTTTSIFTPQHFYSPVPPLPSSPPLTSGPHKWHHPLYQLLATCQPRTSLPLPMIQMTNNILMNRSRKNKADMTASHTTTHHHLLQIFLASQKPQGKRDTRVRRRLSQQCVQSHPTMEIQPYHPSAVLPARKMIVLFSPSGPGETPPPGSATTTRERNQQPGEKPDTAVPVASAKVRDVGARSKGAGIAPTFCVLCLPPQPLAAAPSAAPSAASRARRSKRN